MSKHYFLDGKLFDVKASHVINDTQYPKGTFLNKDMRDMIGITEKNIVKPNYDPLTQYPPMQEDTGEYLPPVEKSLKDAKQNKQNAINQERNKRLQAGITYNGNVFDSDDKSVQRITAIFTFALADPNFTSQFITKDNTQITLSNADCLALGQAAGAHEQTIVFTARELKDRVIAATTNKQVRDISWPI